MKISAILIRGTNFKVKRGIAAVMAIVLVIAFIPLLEPLPVQATITYQTEGAIAYSAENGTSIAPAYPASISSGDLLVLIIGMKPATANGGSVTTPSGWTSITSITGAGGYGTTLKKDSGNTNLFTYYKTAAGTESGSLTVTIADNNVSWAQMFRFTKTIGSWDIAATTGEKTVTGDVSVTFISDPGVAGGDYILGAMCIPTDTSQPNNYSSEALTQTGVTFGTVTEISEPYTATGLDMGGLTYVAPVSSGTSSGAPTLTATVQPPGSNVMGPLVFIRVRELSTTTYIGDGSNPGPSTVAPGSMDNYLDQFTLYTSAGTDSVTALTVTTANTDAVASVEIWNNTMTTQYFSTVSSPSGDTWSFSGGTAIPVTSVSGAFRVIFNAAGASTLQGGNYPVTGTVTSYTCTNTQSGTDSFSATISVDNPVIVSFTVTDNGEAGIHFGELESAVDQPEITQNGTGAVTLQVGSDTNIPINIQIKGDDFSDGLGNTIAVGNVKYDSDSTISGASILTDSYVTWYSVPSHTASTVQCYFWITIAGGQTGGDYTSTFYCQAVPQ